MARMHAIAVSLLGLSFGAGCVDQTKYDALKLERDQLREQLATADGESKASRQGEEAYKSQYQQLLSAGGNSTALLQNYITENGTLRSQNEDLKAKYEDALRNAGKNGGALPAPLATPSANSPHRTPI